MRGKFLYLFVVLSLVAAKVVAQGGFTLNKVPLNRVIKIRLLGSDKDLLQCYNLYGYTYISATDSVSGEFIVLKADDTFQHKDEVLLRFCRVREFAIYAPGGNRNIPVDEGIQLKYPGQKDPIYLNFDPGGPDPVFVPCK